MLNFFKRQVGEESGFWFKVFIPKAVTVGRITGVDKEFCAAMINSERRVLSYTRIDQLMWGCMTGNAESEQDIKAKFEQIWNT